jgi:hypothetical protein
MDSVDSQQPETNITPTIIQSGNDEVASDNAEAPMEPDEESDKAEGPAEQAQEDEREADAEGTSSANDEGKRVKVSLNGLRADAGL